ncbi:Ldh family oxidoreductase [Afifella sp. IM 167]|uniref:Ldh family oxidoreductase n=1 Tax=Afifella sp. IM 167 TaxID=2033586 RepID=UPI001CC99BC3|nr:Ldh family oxidoreductase [Afifella sp. IM 167]MBZ8133847.1 sulfolactate dehydrogenase [Afifella sp. IM 167]
MARLSLSEIDDLIRRALVASRTNETNAASVARALTGAEAAGQAGHGMRRLSAYAAQARSGKVDGNAVPRGESMRPGVLAIDAASGFAYPAIDLALEELPEMARRQGVALAGIRRSGHCGVVGLVVEAFAEKGLIALMFANTPGAMAPWGGKKPLFGTNPIGFAAPVAGEEPVVIDLSLSKVARGKVMAAKQQGGRIPEGWAFDRQGRPTTDPAEGLAGTMAPLGEAKGTALALMVEMLAAGLTGSNYASEASSFFDAEGSSPGVGQLIIAIDPASLGAGATARFAELAGQIAGDGEARVPGRRRQALRREAEKNGIEISDELIAEADAITAMKQE